jgi:Family of unknown function (DUF6364)
MNLTLSVDEQTVERARKVARALGKSLNELVRDYLRGLAEEQSADRDIEELRELTRRAKGRSKGWRFNREELHERS